MFLFHQVWQDLAKQFEGSVSANIVVQLAEIVT